MYGSIRSKLIEVLNSELFTKTAVAYRTDRSKIDKFPAALVMPTDQEADYHQTTPASNKETYIFTIRMLYPFVEGQDTADIALEEAVDEAIRIFRDRTVLDNVVDWVKPVPSVWGYQNRGDGQMRVAELKIQCIVYIDPQSPHA